MYWTKIIGGALAQPATPLRGPWRCDKKSRPVQLLAPFQIQISQNSILLISKNE